MSTALLKERLMWHKESCSGRWESNLRPKLGENVLIPFSCPSHHPAASVQESTIACELFVLQVSHGERGLPSLPVKGLLKKSK
jgi:hypothetical protein